MLDKFISTITQMALNAKKSLQEELEHDSDARAFFTFILCVFLVISALLTHMIPVFLAYVVVGVVWVGTLIGSVCNFIQFMSGRSYFKWLDEFPAVIVLSVLVLLSMLAAGYTIAIPLAIVF